ncbi:thioredoxin family protein [Neoehrlichia mikurensis]|uniref:Thioredoxin family protein n=1 Tax=Neoehrlichia mikurensis TaxID=89586 RepID=A0A9Q9F428_9RICK|nr:thioredoxin family protein [Neoehrlichia mikurensis]QXK92249.1 thioredoxin family protein [Neoehrlichia mikurensis]QXK92704.1 thioredoxin family protein [Neoehrlichia mikurensis]QXK93942.1 thioredoxin family protein [Neoehrlichia mikurensis]UTO55895.1 thioredoxin family protein [Neoehrlichia mikurensis]UTO56811.1 thioredoxin family protein [Neoehrlichia mikurensis]
MVALSTPSVDLQFAAKDFSLKSTDGQFYDLNKCHKGNALLVMFICNHCPYVKAIINRLVQDVTKLIDHHDVKAVAIMPNDFISYPEDSYNNMVTFAKENNFSFPYLIDETQSVAKSYGAVCTPDFFGFNSQLKLCYRGRFDTPNINNVAEYSEKSSELFEAMKFIAKTGKAPQHQKPSIGCSIKWYSFNK